MIHKLFRLLSIAILFPAFLFADEAPQDHNTNPALWNGSMISTTSFRSSSATGPAMDWVVTASEFTGNGGKIEKISGIFRNSLVQNPNPNSWWNQFSYDIIFYPDSAAFIADPFGTSGNHGIVKVNLQAPTNLTHPFEVGYTLNFKLHRLEFDVSSCNMQTTNNATHLIAILPVSSIGSSVTGVTGLNMSIGNGVSVGAGLGWFRSNATNRGPASFSTLQFPYNYTSYKVTLEDVTKPLFSYDINHIVTTLSVQNANLAQLDFGSFTYKVGNIEAWPLLLQLAMTGNPLVYPMITGADSFNVYIFADLYGIPQSFGGCTVGQVCHYAP